MEYRKETHKVYSLMYHVIFVVKYRQKVLLDDVGIIEDCKEKINELSTKFDVNLLERECGSDYAQLLIAAKPTLDITKFINSVKGHSFRYLHQHYREFLRDKLWGDVLWSTRYFIATTGNVASDTLKQYIKNQRGRPERET